MIMSKAAFEFFLMDGSVQAFLLSDFWQSVI